MVFDKDDIKILEMYYSLPFEKLRAALDAAFDEYGVTEEHREVWLGFKDFYGGLLDKNGQFGKKGREIMEKWKGCFGDPLKETSFSMSMID
ncbi:MAG TPA: hypothetical protein IAC73_05630 [Candidatus Limadaptatus stercoripullorum]|uniref:Uncharacterized protein n=1 Tax=Candidatus Limadaptatus stercoripullorum TaxID=2840846 RepID=A0A9D1SWM8_9FIRM|nr:hypothetical protein [Candidatus Limadaptatus stercoripullorum]